MTKILISGFDQDPIIVNNASSFAFSNTVSTSARYNGYITRSPNADLDQFKYDRYFPKSGTYRVQVVFLKATTQGKYDIGVNRVGSTRNTTNIFSGLDLYGASTTYNNTAESVVQVARGINEINLKINGKNASSSAYGNTLQFLEFHLIAEHPVAGEEAPAKSNQGSMVLLAKHTAEVAESTKTFNLADIKSKYSEIVINISGRITAALQLELLVNGLGTSYYQYGDKNLTGTHTSLNLQNQAKFVLMDSAILGTADRSFSGQVKLQLNKDILTQGLLGFMSRMGSFDGSYESAGLNNNAVTAITSITIQTSASTWKKDTLIEVYGVRKT